MLTYRMLERLAYIDARIRNGAYPNSTDFAKELECGIATVKRDIDFLRDRYAAPIAYDASQRGYYYTEPYTLFQNMISVQDAAALAVAKRLLIQYEGTPVYDDLCRAVDGIMALHNGLCFLSIDRIAAPPAPKIIFNENDWRLICRSLTENRIIEFDYNGRWHTDTSHRRVHPYQILLHEGVFHLFGYAEERKAERLFCLPRMKNIIMTEDVFPAPDDYEFSSRCEDGAFGLYFDDVGDTFVIEFYRDARRYARDVIWADHQKIWDDNERDITTVSFYSCQSFKIMEWVLSQGGNAKPVEPKWFAGIWREHIREMMKHGGISV